ncbi:hypothetical protein BU15DRAFT_90082 [Melanogaster broomeanus]|nr:hypothetical protein BU15DRAFT_90082 [Melanogaster broomeanus]
MSQSIPLSRLRTPVTTRFLTEEPQVSSPQDVEDIFPNSTTFDEPPDPIKSPRKRAAFDLLERPTSSSSAFLLHIASTSLIVFSALSFHSTSPRVWFGLETSLVVLFTVEYSARLFAWSSSWITLVKWMFYALAILPYYIEIMLQQDTSVLFRFSILRMFRLLRVFRPFRYNSTILLTIEVMYLAIRRSHHALLALSFFIAMVLTIFSTLLYLSTPDGDPSQFPVSPVACTITTVGYGEMTPRSVLGRLITVPLLAFGLLLIALPSFVLGREFSIVWEQMTRHENAGEDRVNPDMLSAPFLPTTQRRLDSQSQFQSLFAPAAHPQDLSNRKLAQNQTELSQQISELRVAVETQGETIRQLLVVLEGRTREVGVGDVKGKGRQSGSVSWGAGRNSIS